MNVKKRDGSLVKYNHEKIINTIAKVGEATGEFDKKEAEILACKFIACKDIIDILGIQNIIEDILVSSKYKKTARIYTRVCYQKNRVINFVKEIK